MARRRVLAFPWYASATILVLGLATTGFFMRADLQEREATAYALGVETTSALRSALADELNGYVATTRAGAAFVDTAESLSAHNGVSTSDIIRDGFPTFADNLVLTSGPALRDFQLAPAGIVTYSAHPNANQSAIGHNLLVDDARRDETLASVIAREAVFTGPIDLLQGGRGVIAREAVFTTNDPGFAARYEAVTGAPPPNTLIAKVPIDFWGFATSVIDFDALIADVQIAVNPGLPTVLDPTTMALTTEADGAAGTIGQVVWGTAEAVQPVNPHEDIELPGPTHWTLWSTPTPANPLPSALIGLIGVALTIAFLMLSRNVYRANRRARIGFAFGEQIVSDHDRLAMIEFAARFVAGYYPTVTGRIRLRSESGTAAPIGSPDVHDPPIWSSEVSHGDDVQCEVEVTDFRRVDAKDFGAFIALIGTILGANLASAGRRIQLEEESGTDTLTQVFNRRHFQEIFEDKRRVARTLNWQLAVAVIDIDNFKSVNDTYGHLFGDAILTALSSGIGHSIRDFDVVFRFGGDEFIIICLLEHGEHAQAMFERIHESANASMRAHMPDNVACTASIGYYVADESRDERTHELLAKADQALYDAKDQGRNIVRAWVPSRSMS